VRYPGCCFCGVMESFAIPFRKRVALVFRDIIYVINILYVDISYAALQAHRIINVAPHREYSLGIVFIFAQGSTSIMSKINTSNNSS
jgi:hypothetical protein